MSYSEGYCHERDVAARDLNLRRIAVIFQSPGSQALNVVDLLDSRVKRA